MLRITLIVLLLFSFVLLGTKRDAHAAGSSSGLRFEITGSGSLTHLESVVPGQKPFVSKVTAAQIAACITGTPPIDCNSGALEIDAGGKAFLYVPDAGNGEIIYISTDSACANLTQLDGLIGGTGTFMYAGHHTKSDTDLLIQGTVTFVKGTTTPVSIKKASIMAVSNRPSFEHYAVGTFVTVGAAVPISCLP